MSITHSTTVVVADDGVSPVGTNEWNAAHVATLPIGFVIDGGSNAITSGVKGDLEMAYAGTITQVTLLADAAGSIVVDIGKATYSGWPTVTSITASAKPTLTSAQKYQDTGLTGWTTTFAAGDVLRFSVTSATTVKRVTVSLRVTA